MNIREEKRREEKKRREANIREANISGRYENIRDYHIREETKRRDHISDDKNKYKRRKVKIIEDIHRRIEVQIRESQ